MNYILEIKAFYNWLEVNQLPTSAIVLWHALMHIANKTGWKDNFTVAVVVLEIKTGLKKQAVLNARTALQNKGLISFVSRSGNQSAIYSMKSVAEGMNDLVSFKETQSDTQGHTQGHTQTHTQTHTQGHTINNNDINNNYNNIIKDVVVNTNGYFKETQRDTQSDTQEVPQEIKTVRQHFESTCGMMSSTAYLELAAFLEEGVESSLIQAAIDKTIDNGVYKWAYVKKILDNCAMANVKTLEQFLAKERRYQDDNNREHHGKQGTKKDAGGNHGGREGTRLNELAKQYQADDTDCEY